MKNPSPASCNTFYLVHRNTRGRLSYYLVFISLRPFLNFMFAFPGSFSDQNQIPYLPIQPPAPLVIQPFMSGLLPPGHFFGFLLGTPKPPLQLFHMCGFTSRNHLISPFQSKFHTYRESRLPLKKGGNMDYSQ